MKPARLLLLPALLITLAACGGKDARESKAGTVNGVADEALPTPAGAPGSAVTGMPHAREPLPGAAADAALPPPVDEATDPATDVAAAPEATAAEPTPQDAVAVIRDYYAALNAGDFAHAHGLWSDGGRASGQSLQQFTEGFAQTQGVSVQIGEPSDMEGAAGSRYVEVPVTLDATQRDGSQHRYAGTFTLRRAVVDGATDEQRAWHIASSNLREQ